MSSSLTGLDGDGSTNVTSKLLPKNAGTMRREYPKGTRSSSHTVENERIARHAAHQSQHAGSFQSDEPPCLLFTIYIGADLITNDQQGIRIGTDGGIQTTGGI